MRRDGYRRLKRRLWLRKRVGREWVSTRDLADEMKGAGLYAESTYVGDISVAIKGYYLGGTIEIRGEMIRSKVV